MPHENFSDGPCREVPVESPLSRNWEVDYPTDEFIRMRKTLSEIATAIFVSQKSHNLRCDLMSCMSPDPEKCLLHDNSSDRPRLERPVPRPGAILVSQKSHDSRRDSISRHEKCLPHDNFSDRPRRERAVPRLGNKLVLVEI